MKLMYVSVSSPSSRISGYINKQPRYLHHDLRVINQFVVPHFRVNQVKFNFEHQALSLWNSLPAYIKESNSIKIFKRLYVDFLIKDYCSHAI